MAFFPDGIALLDQKNGEEIMSEEAKVGDVVALLGIPCVKEVYVIGFFFLFSQHGPEAMMAIAFSHQTSVCP